MWQIARNARKRGRERSKKTTSIRRERNGPKTTAAKVVSIDCVVVCTRVYCVGTNFPEKRSGRGVLCTLSRDENGGEFHATGTRETSGKSVTSKERRRGASLYTSRLARRRRIGDI